MFWCLSVWIPQGAPASSPPAVSVPVFRNHTLPAGYGALPPGKPLSTSRFAHRLTNILWAGLNDPLESILAVSNLLDMKCHFYNISIITQCIEVASPLFTKYSFENKKLQTAWVFESKWLWCSVDPSLSHAFKMLTNLSLATLAIEYNQTFVLFSCKSMENLWVCVVFKSQILQN